MQKKLIALAVAGLASTAAFAAMMSAWVAFVRDGQPTLSSGGGWPCFDPRQPAVARFGNAGQAAAMAVDRQQGLACWPAYR